MPAYGGHYSSLSSFLPPSTQPVMNLSRFEDLTDINNSFNRSNLALLLLCDLIRPEFAFDWSDQMALLLHVSMLGLDSPRALICRHARKTIIATVLLHSPFSLPIGQIASILLNNQVIDGHFMMSLSETIFSWLQTRLIARQLPRPWRPALANKIRVMNCLILTAVVIYCSRRQPRL
jgi:hypothetical protein